MASKTINVNNGETSVDYTYRDFLDKVIDEQPTSNRGRRITDELYVHGFVNLGLRTTFTVLDTEEFARQVKESLGLVR